MGSSTPQGACGVIAAKNLEVLDPPSAPVLPVYPNRSLLVTIGLLAGLLAGLTASYALRWRIAIMRKAAH
jgi:uncharacterized protein involved in exopolysaccharide biosynthesis